MVVKRFQGIELIRIPESDGRVVPEQYHLDPLQAHDPVGLRPAPVVADAHAEDPAERPPHREAEVPDFEKALFKVLSGTIKHLGMPGQIYLAIFADYPTGLVNQD